MESVKSSFMENAEWLIPANTRMTKVRLNHAINFKLMGAVLMVKNAILVMI